MNARSPTKIEIAQAVGVSRTCVSQVLNQVRNARISVETRGLIMEEARKRGYQSAPPANRPVASNGIAYIYCDQRSPYQQSISHVWPLILHELQRLAAQDDRFVAFLGNSIDAMSLQALYRSLDNMRPMGVVLDGIVPDSLLAELRNRSIPYVIFGAAALGVDERDRPQSNIVTIDYDEVVGQLMNWLHGRGCRRIALSCGLLRSRCHSVVFEAYRRWGDRLGLPFDAALVQFGEDSAGAEIFTALGRLGVRHDGIILCSMSRAVRALPFLPPVSHSVRSVGVIGSPDASVDWISDMAVAGPPCRELARAIYRVISGEFNYQTKQKKYVAVPSVLVEAG